MSAPAYYRSRRGRVFRVQRRHETLSSGAARFVLRAFAVPGEWTDLPVAEVSDELTAEALRDYLQRRLVVATPEERFNALWQRLRLDLEAA
jgi:hypothetical protein